MSLNKADVVKTYIALRDRRAKRKAEFEAADAEDKQAQEKIEAYFLKGFNEEGVDSIKTEHGSVYRSTRSSASVADWDAFFNGYVLPNQAWEFLEHRANKSSVEQYKANSGDLPPGINWSETQTVNVRRS